MTTSEGLDLSLVADLLRRLKGLSIAELARRADVNRPVLTTWLGGRKKVLSAERQDRVCECLDWRFGCLIPARMHAWAVREREDILTLQKAIKLLFPPGTEIRIAGIGYKEERIGNLLFVIPPEGSGSLIRLRRELPASVNKNLDLCALLNAQPAESLSISEEEFLAVWQKDVLDLRARDYLDNYHRDRSLSTALDRNSTAWRADTQQPNPNDEEISFRAEDEDLPAYDLNAFAPIRELTIADIEEEALAREDYDWKPLVRRLQKLGVSPQETLKMMQPHLELIELRQKLARYESSN